MQAFARGMRPVNIASLRAGFRQADPRFGPVPLWWWSGERVTPQRLRRQVGKLRAAGLRNLCIINLAPSCATYLSHADDPPFYSEQWWALFDATLAACAQEGVFLWYYDQIGFSGANFPARLVNQRPEFAGYRLRRLGPDDDLPPRATVLAEAGGHRYAAVRQGFDWLSPQAAAALLDRIHGEMERRHSDELGRTIAGSFQDELQAMPNWTAELPDAWRRKYGEAVEPHLPLILEGGPGAAPLRRRLYDLLGELAEAAFFGPLGAWHERHGMLLGCDQAGAGRMVDPHGAQRLYIDYFRTHRHFSAPGCDMDGEVKPHASLVHTHGGRRVWLEGFHSSGWGGSIEETLHWLVPWLQAGVTLFDPHAVYYSTRGGWWEWAPPDTGWRQPYAEHYPVFADTVARACWLLSQGTHACDIAVYYPGQVVWEHMSPLDQRIDEHPHLTANRDPDDAVARLRDTYWSLVGRQARHTPLTGVLRGDRRDFDLVDDHALASAGVVQGALSVRDERYRAIVLPGALPSDPGARACLDAFAASGGLLVAVGVPGTTGLPPATIHVATPAEVPGVLSGLSRQVEGPGLSLVRRGDGVDTFLLLPPLEGLLPMHAAATREPDGPGEATYRLRTGGTPELWDPVRGTQVPLEWKRDGDSVTVTVPFADWPAALVVCPVDPPAAEVFPSAPEGSVRPAVPAWSGGPATVLADHGWTVRPVPTLDNGDGDFDLHGPHAGPDGLLEIERRSFRVRPESGEADGQGAGWHLQQADDRDWEVRLWSEAARARTCRGEHFDPDQARPVVYSAVFGDLRHREWAGRMGRVPRLFLHLGEARRGEVVWAQTWVAVPEAAKVWLQVEGRGDKSAWLDGQEVLGPAADGPHSAQVPLTLSPGTHELRLRCTAVRDGAVRLGAAFTLRPPAAQPEWIGPPTSAAAGPAVLHHTVHAAGPARRARLLLATHGLVELHVNGHRVAVEGDFNPYTRSGQQELDLRDFWRVGPNALELHFPERLPGDRALVDTDIACTDGTQIDLVSGPHWCDARGHAAARIPHAGETEALWIRPRPHMLAGVGWLQPESVPEPAPLPLLLDRQARTAPVWLRAQLPVGACGVHLETAGRARLWIDGQEVDLVAGDASFEPRPAGAVCAIRVIPQAGASEAAVLTAPLRIRTAAATGSLGDWRTALQLPHHSGVVEYERDIQAGPGPAWIDLGYVRGTAQVWIDGQDAGVRCWHPYRFALPALRGPGPHRLRVRVTNTLGAHYEVGRPTQLLRPGQAAGGMFGPVRLAGATPAP